MRIAEVATLATPVSRLGSGSIEAIVWHLAKGLVERGHDVTVFAAAGSDPCGELVAALPGTYGVDGAPEDWQLCEWENVAAAVAQSERFDLVHSHNYLWGLPLEPVCRAPMVHTLHVLPYEDSARLLRLHPGATVTAVSAFQWSEFAEVAPAAEDVVHHGVDPADFSFRAEPDDYLCYLGRFLPEKGVRAAIEAAREMGVALRLAGPRDAYFDEEIAPLVDGDAVQYVGTVTGPERDQLLGGARALLYPITLAEPFGLVLPEAMMCGTPVVASALGAVPELVDDGLTGALAPPDFDSGADLVASVERALVLDRRRVRERAVERFGVDRMVDGYLRVFDRVTGVNR
ncbi:MAG: glycosyl transferase group 1 [Acidimicrobiales bacterium]|nr:glycosyl transferase group 1 [Acidimicrobiales bacterium]